jgi:hypothetical protein
MYGDDAVKKTTLTGVVVKARLGGTSKSAHVSFVLKTKDARVKLRREGGSPFYDDYFEPYENTNVQVEGFDMDSYFLVTAVKPAVSSGLKK